MFELQKLFGSTERSIIVETKKGHRIENSIALPPMKYNLDRHQKIAQEFGAKWEERKPPCGEYNCAGHVWASRRTAIYEDEEYLKIIKDDEYRKLSPSESARVGDLVIYRDENNILLHVGMIIELRELTASLHGGSDQRRFIPWVLSKWDDTSGEYIHNAFEVDHYRKTFPKLIIEYWTERLFDE